MTDIALAWNADRFAADLLLTGGKLVTDDGMRTTILISLFSDARAPDDAELPEEGRDRRGWWGDSLAKDAGRFAGTARDPDRIGSLLWLLERAKVVPQSLRFAQQACEDALAWLIRDGVAGRVGVQVEAQGDRMAIGVEIDRPSGPGRQRFDFAWEASTHSLFVLEPHS